MKERSLRLVFILNMMNGHTALYGSNCKAILRWKAADHACLVLEWGSNALVLGIGIGEVVYDDVLLCCGHYCKRMPYVHGVGTFR